MPREGSVRIESRDGVEIVFKKLHGSNRNINQTTDHNDDLEEFGLHCISFDNNGDKTIQTDNTEGSKDTKGTEKEERVIAFTDEERIPKSPEKEEGKDTNPIKEGERRKKMINLVGSKEIEKAHVKKEDNRKKGFKDKKGSRNIRGLV